MTPTWVTIVVAVFAGVAGSVLATVLRSRHERLADLREKMLDKGSAFSADLQAAFGPVIRAIDARTSEPDDDEEAQYDGDDDDEEVDDDDIDPRTLWSPEMVRAYDAAEEAFLRAEAALSPLLLLVREESVAIRASQRAISMLSTAIGSLREPDDETQWSRFYLLDAQLSWRAFNRAMRKEIARTGRRVAPQGDKQEYEEFAEWMRLETEKRTAEHPTTGRIHIVG